VASYIDPFGAQDYLVDDVAFRSMVGTDFVRFGYYTLEEGEKILRVKLVFPVRRLIEAQDETRAFVTQQRCRRERMSLAMN
jgi:hypothetical protein